MASCGSFVQLAASAGVFQNNRGFHGKLARNKFLILRSPSIRKANTFDEGQAAIPAPKYG